MEQTMSKGEARSNIYSTYLTLENIKENEQILQEHEERLAEYENRFYFMGIAPHSTEKFNWLAGCGVATLLTLYLSGDGLFSSEFLNFLFSIGFIISLIFFVIAVFSMVKNILTSNKEREARIESAKNEKPPVLENYAEIKSEIERDFILLETKSIVPYDYQTPGICLQFCQYFDNHRVDTIKEAINLFEAEQRHAELVEQRKEQLRVVDNLRDQVWNLESDLSRAQSDLIEAEYERDMAQIERDYAESERDEAESRMNDRY